MKIHDTDLYEIKRVVAKYITQDCGLREDVVQLTLLALLDSDEPKGNRRSFVCTVSRNVSISMLNDKRHGPWGHVWKHSHTTMQLCSLEQLTEQGFQFGYGLVVPPNASGYGRGNFYRETLGELNGH